jgi:hypothetical protein
MARGKLQKIAESLESIRRILYSGIWIVILLILLAALGWFVLQWQLDTSGRKSSSISSKVVKPIRPPIDWREVDKALAASLQSARQEARDYADGELESWTAAMLSRSDGFLDWYFSYWTQQLLGLKGLYQYGVHYVLKSRPSASEKLTEEIQLEFSQRVLQPQIAQKVIERIAAETADRYVAVLQQELVEVPEAYGVGRAEWQSYLEDIAITVGTSAGGRRVPLTLKTLTVSGVGGTALLAGHMKGMVSEAGSKIMRTSSGRAASLLAAKTGGKVAAKVGGKFFGTITGVGVLVWDAWDHTANERENRPLLRRSLEEYFVELKMHLLDDPEFGLMVPLHQFEEEITRKHRE